MKKKIKKIITLLFPNSKRSIVSTNKTSNWLIFFNFIKIYFVYKYNIRNSVKENAVSKGMSASTHFER